MKLGGNVCYESIFPVISRRLARNGAGILVNVTNDGWYMKTAAPYQHLHFNVFRAVENRRPLVRCANTGISAFIDEKGRTLSETGIFEEAWLSAEVIPRYKM